MREYSHQEFRAFLSHYRDDEIVGTTQASPTDPLTLFFRQHTASESIWYCGFFLFYVDEMDEKKKIQQETTPDWAAAFGFFLQSREEATGLVCREVLDIVTRGVA